MPHSDQQSATMQRSTSEYDLVRLDKQYPHQLPAVTSLHRAENTFSESWGVTIHLLQVTATVYLLPVCPLEQNPPTVQPIPRVWPLGCQS